MIREAGGEPRCPGNEEGTRVGEERTCANAFSDLQSGHLNITLCQEHIERKPVSFSSPLLSDCSLVL